ncbi:MAG TPA: peroxiredoxin [Nocardioidaceae bacterium]|jgi:peroxiredoxin|nr:peroxiredoxin [Nocardioidaceae bacterium]
MTVEIGQEAPDFELRDQHGQDLSLSSLRDQKAVVLMFYPYAFSGVCTHELCDIRDNLADFVTDRAQLLAVSCDPMFSLRAFAERDGLNFPLLSDFWPHGEVSRAYGVFDDERGCSRRSTFILDKAGVVRWSVHNAMPQARSRVEYRRVLEEIGA